MSGLLRRIRGALGTALTWSVAWTVGQVTVLAAAVLTTPGTVPFIAFVGAGISGAVVGFLSGLAFSTAFSLINRNKAIEEIEIGQSTLLGAGAGMLFPAAIIGLYGLAGFPVGGMAVIVNVLIGAAMGGATSYGLVRVAKSGLELDAPAVDVGLGPGDSTPAIGPGGTVE